ncbi:MAG TPA: hypothetical protein VM509_12995, partial [Planctomycetota bacterium]|nr:hypothetical protein [Planctomycetota bacterium]
FSGGQPAEAVEAPPPFFSGSGLGTSSSWTATPAPFPDSGDLEAAMRDLRDEIRALRESMQGLRDRIHTMSEDSLR